MNFDKDEETPVIFGLDFQARCLAPCPSDDEKTIFAAGTQSLKSVNQVYFLHYDDELNQISKEVYAHPAGELWHLSVFPADRNIIASCYDAVPEATCVPGCSIWQVPSNDESASLKELELRCSLSVKCQNCITGFHWQPIEPFNKALCLVDERAVIVDVEGTNKNMTVISDEAMSGVATYRITCGKWNPHHNCNTYAAVTGGSVYGYDIRTNKEVFSISTPHCNYVRDIDFNPNRNYYLATAGDDCRICFWDTRAADKPVKDVTIHSHWVWSVRFNPIHDQLFISSGSDARVVLHCIVSISSEALDEDEVNDDDTESPIHQLADGVIRRYEDHEESVYCCEWSSVDPWVFSSLSYDGRIIINTVPRKVKYSILNL